MKLATLIGPPWKRHESLWIPRYLGFTVPAILVLAVLFSRLPSALRAVAVTFFVAVNLGQFGDAFSPGANRRWTAWCATRSRGRRTLAR